MIMIEAQVFCITEQKIVIGFFEDLQSVRCPNNLEHTIDTNSISILREYTPLGLPIDSRGRLRVVNTSCSCSEVFTYYTSNSDDNTSSLLLEVTNNDNIIKKYIDFNHDIEVLSGTLLYDNVDINDSISFGVEVPATQIESWVEGVKLKKQLLSNGLEILVKADDNDVDDVYQIKGGTIPYPIDYFDPRTWQPLGQWSRQFLPVSYTIDNYVYLNSGGAYIFSTQPINLYKFVNNIHLANKTGTLLFEADSGFKCLHGWRLVLEFINGNHSRTDICRISVILKIARKLF